MAKQKATELPIYVSKNETAKTTDESSMKPNPVEPYVADVRHQIVGTLHPQVGEFVKQVQDAMSGVCDQVTNLRDVVRQDPVAEATFITSAVFFGYIVGRRSYFRRILYATVFGAGAWAWAEPRQFKDYTEVARDLAKQKGHEIFLEINGPEYLEHAKQFLKRPFSSSISPKEPSSEEKKSN